MATSPRLFCVSQLGVIYRGIVFTLIMLFAATALLAGCGGPNDAPGMVEVRQTMQQPGNARVSKSAPLAKGTAVLVDDAAGYWVRDGKVYAVNGVAQNMSPGITDAPASISMQVLQDALDGKAPEVPPLFAMSPSDLAEKVNAVLAQYNVPELKKSTYLSYEMAVDGDLRAQLSLTELGGELKQATVDLVLIKEKNMEPLRLCQAFMAVLNPDDTEEARAQVLNALFTDAMKEKGTVFLAQLSGVRYSMGAGEQGQVFLQAFPPEK